MKFLRHALGALVVALAAACAADLPLAPDPAEASSRTLESGTGFIGSGTR